MIKKKGFTLIELLVVIAIIALLLAVMLPSLRAAKELASGAVCLSNQKNLCLSWVAYAEDNNSNLVGGSNYYVGTRATPYRWVERPLLNDTDSPERTAPATPSQYSEDTRRNGIRAGKLFTYLEDEDVYHCPGDKSNVKYPEPKAVFRSYAITGLMNGEDFISRQSGLYSRISQYRTVSAFGSPKVLYNVAKMGEITSPGTKYVFVEEEVASHGQDFSYGGFVLLNSGNYNWWDYPADYHNESSTVGFADGHAERRRWQDSDTIKLIKESISDPDPRNNEDLQWMIRGYMPRP